MERAPFENRERCGSLSCGGASGFKGGPAPEIGVKVELGGFKVGVERTNTQEEGQAAKTEWVPGFEKGKFEGSNAELGVGAGGCLLLCGQIEVGVQADKILSDIGNAAGNAISNYVAPKGRP